MLKILLSSHFFSPALGGIETVSALLAEQFTQAGHQVIVVTTTPLPAGMPEPVAPYEVVRNPATGRFLSLLKWSDLCFQNNISLQYPWPLAIAARPWVVAHQTWMGSSWKDGLKRRSLRWGSNISISAAVAARLPVASVVIPNPYDAAVFWADPAEARTKDLVFVGRLVSDKGVDLLIQAIGLLRGQGLAPTVTIVGGGSDAALLQAQVAAAGLGGQIDFAGPMHGPALARVLNQYRIMVIPSRWDEPFGVVALEGIACGCVTVGSSGGGLPEAMGPCGVTFPNGNAAALAGALAGLLRDPARQRALQAHAAGHLARHTPRLIAEGYLQVFAQAG